MTRYGDPTPCECCGAAPATETYGEADDAGHVWTHHVCGDCRRDCSSDPATGSPVHMRAGWDGRPETFAGHAGPDPAGVKRAADAARRRLYGG